MTEHRTVSLIGLPRTGKSTYLGALWLLVQDPGVPELSEEDFTGDRSYVDMLGDQVARGLEITRTEIDSDQGFSMTLGFAGEGAALVEMPDLSGEAVRVLAEERVWRKVMGDALSRSQALMLFVHPDEIDMPVPVNFAVQAAGMPASTAETIPAQREEFAPGKACTAAKLVDALENILELRWEAWPIPIAVVVSAWDRVDSKPTPTDWLATHLPGVHGLLDANPDLARYATFGVSAQGGRLPEEKEKLTAKSVSERVFAVAPDGTDTTLYEALRWVLWE